MRRSGTARQKEARRCTEAIRDLLLGYRARMEEELRERGVTLPQLRMLKVIEQQENVSAARIARLCQITPQTLQSMLARATREGWIVRGTSQRNGRIVTASLTRSGKEIVRQGMQLAARIEEEIWLGIPLERMQAVRETLEVGLAHLDRGENPC